MSLTPGSLKIILVYMAVPLRFPEAQPGMRHLFTKTAAPQSLPCHIQNTISASPTLPFPPPLSCWDIQFLFYVMYAL